MDPRSKTPFRSGFGFPLKLPAFRLQTQLVVVFLLLCTGMLGFACSLSYTLADRVFFEKLRLGLEADASLIAVGIDGDRFERIRSEREPAFRQVKSHLAKHGSALRAIRSAYTMRPGKGTMWRFVVDGEPSSSPFCSPYGESYDIRQDPAIAEALKAPASSHQLTEDRWGTWLSGFAPIRNSAGRAVGIVGIDMSARNYLKERVSLRRIALSIFVIGCLLTALTSLWFARKIANPQEATQRELRTMHDRALEVAELKSSFLSAVSHEIRTPMHAILSMNTLLLETQLEEDARHFAEIMLDSTKSLLVIIDDVLDSSKIEAGKMTVENIPFAPTELIERVVDLFAPKAMEKGVILTAYLAPDIPSQLLGDPNRFRQILLNLVSNAIKFTEQGRIRVEATFQRELSVQVIDTGIGITPEAQEHLLQPFSQADRSTARRFGGTGLGLYLCKSLIELMGGRFEIESVEGQGSTFRVVLPLPVVDAACENPPACGRVLLALRPPDRPVFCRYLEAWGIPFEFVEPEELCLALAAASEPFEVAIIDGPIPSPSPAEVRWVLLAIFGEHPAEFSAVLQQPVKRKALRDALEPPVATQDEPAQPALPQSAPILLVEDNPINREIALRYLQRLDLVAQVATDGAEAVEACRKQAFDLILMDCQMPCMDGFQATQLIRQQEGPRRTPILAMTAGAMAGERQRCEESGMDGFLGKPYTVEELYRAIQPYLSRPLLDREALRRDCPDEAELQALLEAYFESADGLVRKMRSALEAQEREPISRAAHELKGASGFMAAPRIARQCAGIEGAVAHGGWEDVQPAIEVLEALLSRARDAVQASGRLSSSL